MILQIMPVGTKAGVNRWVFCVSSLVEITGCSSHITSKSGCIEMRIAKSEQPSDFKRAATGGQMKRAEMISAPLQDGAAGAFGKLRGWVLAEKAKHRKKQ